MKHMIKKWVCLIITIAICFSCVSATVTTVNAMTENDVRQRLNEMIKQYPDGSGWSGSFEGASQCFGFAGMVFHHIFGIYMPRNHANSYWLISTPGYDGVNQVGQLPPGQVNANSVKNLLSQAKTGDVIQAKGSVQHTMIVDWTSDSGIGLFDCNSDGKGTVRIRSVTYQKFASTYYQGITLYRSKNYPPSQPTDTTQPVISNVQVTGIHENGYTVTCTVTDDNSGVDRVTFPTWTGKNGQDDILWNTGTITGNTVKFVISRFDHNNEYGVYYTDIYAYDKAGNSSAYYGISELLAPYLVDAIAITQDKQQIFSAFHDELTWWDAYSQSITMNGLLAVASNEEQKDIIAKIAGNSKSNVPYFYLGCRNLSDSWTWITGEPFAVNNWAPGEPNNDQGVEDKLSVAKNGLWNDLSENFQESGFIMKTPVIRDESITTTYNGHKYVLYDKPMPWGVAKAYCEALGGHLATIESKGESDEVAKLTSKGKYLSYAIGISNEEDGVTWKQVTGEDVSYTNWVSGEPNNTDGIEKYGYMNKDSGLWNDNRSFPGDAGFICEFDTAIGDINGDSAVSVLDIQMIQRHISGIKTLTAEQKTAADVNGDGIINIFDVQRIQRSILGIQKLN